MAPRSTFNAKDAAEIVERLSKGEPLTHICADEWLPCDDTVRTWAEKDAAFARDIARAREAGFDAIALECLAIADHSANDTKVIEGESGRRETCNAEWISRSKLRVETRLKLLAKWDPKRYGDSVSLKHSDPDGGPVRHSIDLSALTEAQLAAVASIKLPTDV